MRLKHVFNNTIFYPYQYPKFRKGSMVRIKHRYKYATNNIDGIFETDKPSGSVTPNTGVKALKPDYLPYHIRKSINALHLFFVLEQFYHNQPNK